MPLLLSNHTLPPPCASLTHTELVALLQRSGLRLTQSRSLMLATLLRCPTPVTLAQLQTAIQPRRVALATLFRSMLRLEEAELVTRTIDHHGTTNWELSVGRGRTFHLTDRQTGEIARLDADIAQPLHDLLARVEQTLARRGYRHLQLNIAFHGGRPKSATGRRVA
jgi:Fe2+ or Zn2+ uptake regulation protein